MEVKKIKKKFLFIIIFFLCISSGIISYSKYVFDTTINIAELNLDRQKPVINSEEIQIANKKETQDIIAFVEVQEKNLDDNKLDETKIEIYVDSKKASLPINIEKLEENNKKGESEFKIQITDAPKDKKIQLKIKEGAFTDKAGWKNEEYMQTLSSIENS